MYIIFKKQRFDVIKEIDESVLLECIQQLYKYNFGDIKKYWIINDIIFSEVSSDPTKEFYSTKTVDIIIDEYEYFMRTKKLHHIKENLC